MTLVLRVQVFDLCCARFEVLSAKNCLAEAGVAVHTALTRSAERSLLGLSHTIIGRCVVLVSAYLRVVGRVALVWALDLLSVEVHFVHLSAVSLVLADWESDAIHAVLSVVLHIIVVGSTDISETLGGLPADVDLGRVRVVRQALLARLDRATSS